MNVSDFDYELPEELIAQDPIEDRSSSRLLMLDKKTGAIEHHIFRDIIDALNPGDCLVINNTRCHSGPTSWRKGGHRRSD